MNMTSKRSNGLELVGHLKRISLGQIGATAFIVMNRAEPDVIPQRWHGLAEVCWKAFIAWDSCIN